MPPTATHWLEGGQRYFAQLAALSPQTLQLNVGLSLAVVVAAVLLCWAAGKLLCWSLRLIPNLGTADRQAKARQALGLTSLGLRAVVIACGLSLITAIWGLDIWAWTATPWGSMLAATGSRVIIICLGAAIILEIADLAMGYALGRLKTRAKGDPRRRSQIDTLSPILSSAARISIVIVAAITLLSQVGVEIAPLLASAGVVGIAVGFGAQTLVKDFFTGFFLIIEDIVAIGDVVQIQVFSGTVEQMTLRTIRLRDFDGTLHIFPYGEAQIIHNLTKTYSFAAFDLPLRYDSDLDKAMEVMKSTAETMRKDPYYGPLILNDIEIPGPDLLSDIGIIVKARIRTQPRDRWLVFREYNRRIKPAFDKAGIVMTHK